MSVSNTSVVDPVMSVADLRIWVPGADGPVEVVEGVDFEVRPGEVFGIAGESGSGKTITALALMGLLPSGGRSTGTARLGNIDLLSVSGRAWSRVRGVEIAMVFQDPLTSLHPMLTIGKQLVDHVVDHNLATRNQAKARAIELLELVRIPDPVASISAYPHQFSGGMRQRVAIAMALACSPKLLIADEPTTALDVTVQAGILHLIRDLCTTSDMAVLLITHDLGVMSAVADRLAVYYAGRIVETGSLVDLLGKPRHPYTRGLLDALPAFHGGITAETFAPIPGSPPAPDARPPACSFHPRCSWAQPQCSREPVPLVDIGMGRSLACPVDPLKPE